MKGRLLLERATTEKEFRAAIELFKQTTELDAVYAPGWAGLAEATWSLAATGFEFVPPASVRDEALSAAKKALELDEQLPEAHNARVRAQPTGSGTRKRLSTIGRGRSNSGRAMPPPTTGTDSFWLTSPTDSTRRASTSRLLVVWIRFRRGTTSTGASASYSRTASIGPSRSAVGRLPGTQGISSSAGSGAMPFWL